MQSNRFRIPVPVPRPSRFVLCSAVAVVSTCVVLIELLAEFYDTLYGDVTAIGLVPPLILLSFSQVFTVLRPSALAARMVAATCFAPCIPLAVAAAGGEMLSLPVLAVFSTGCAANITWARTIARWARMDRIEPPGFPVLPPRQQP